MDDERYDRNWWTGENSFWGKYIAPLLPESGTVGYGGATYEWDMSEGDVLAKITTAKEEDYLKWGFMALGVYVIITMVGK